MLGTLLEGYESVVIDAGSTLDERVLNVFEAAETIILPVYPEMAALKSVHALLDYLNEAGSIGAKATFVLNNMFAREILKPRDIEAALGTKISTDLPYDAVPVPQGGQRGRADRHRRPALDAGRTPGAPERRVVRARRVRRAGPGRRSARAGGSASGGAADRRAPAASTATAMPVQAP